MNKYTPAVLRGAKLLDEKFPGWQNEIDLDRLFLSDCHQCILGQIYGNYFFGLKSVGVHWLSDEDIIYGFCTEIDSCFIDDDNYFDEYDLLTEAWKEYLTSHILDLTELNEKPLRPSLSVLYSE